MSNKLTLLLEVPVSWCSVRRPPTTCCLLLPFQQTHFPIDCKKQAKKKKKSMHGFDWRPRRRCWFGHVCLRSGHCWRPAVSSGERKSALLCPSIAESCVKVEGRDSSLPGKLLMVYKLQNTFSLPLSHSPVPPLFRWPLELHSLWASLLKKKTKRNTLLLSTHMLR